MDGAQFSKRKSVVNMVMTFVMLGSKAHSPTLNFDVSKYLGSETEADIRNCFGQSFGAINDLVDQVVDIRTEIGKLSFVFDYFVVADAKCLYSSLGHSSFTSDTLSLWCRDCRRSSHEAAALSPAHPLSAAASSTSARNNKKKGKKRTRRRSSE